MAKTIRAIDRKKIAQEVITKRLKSLNQLLEIIQTRLSDLDERLTKLESQNATVSYETIPTIEEGIEEIDTQSD